MSKIANQFKDREDAGSKPTPSFINKRNSEVLNAIFKEVITPEDYDDISGMSFEDVYGEGHEKQYILRMLNKINRDWNNFYRVSKEYLIKG